MISGRIGFVADKLGLGLLGYRCNHLTQHHDNDLPGEAEVEHDIPAQRAARRYRGVWRRILTLLKGTSF